MSDPKSVRVRFAERTMNDAEAMHNLVVLHAEYEEEPEAVSQTRQSIRQELTRGVPYFRGMFAEIDGKVVGEATIWPCYRSWSGVRDMWLDDIYLLREARGHQVGRKMVAEIARETMRSGGTKLMWVVGTDNKSGIGFYHSLGGRAVPDCLLCKLEQATVERLGKNVLLPDNYKFRFACAADAPQLLELLKGCASKFERTERVTVTEEVLRAQLSSDSPPFECIITEHNNTPVGMCLFWTYYSAWRGPGIWLEDLYVTAQHRATGLAEVLLRVLCSIALKREWHRPGIQYIVGKQNERTLALLDRLGQTRLEKWLVYEMDAASMTSLSEKMPNTLYLPQSTQVEDLALAASHPSPFPMHRSLL